MAKSPKFETLVGIEGDLVTPLTAEDDASYRWRGYTKAPVPSVDGSSAPADSEAQSTEAPAEASPEELPSEEPSVGAQALTEF